MAMQGLDSDSKPFISTPYKLRHGARSVQVNLTNMPMVRQLLKFVPAQVHIESYQRVGPQGIEAIFVGFVENHGTIKSVAMLIPLEPCWQALAQ